MRSFIAEAEVHDYAAVEESVEHSASGTLRTQAPGLWPMTHNATISANLSALVPNPLPAPFCIEESHHRGDRLRSENVRRCGSHLVIRCAADGVRPLGADLLCKSEICNLDVTEGIHE